MKKKRMTLERAFIIIGIVLILLVNIYCIFIKKPDLIDLFIGIPFVEPFIYTSFVLAILLTLYSVIKAFKRDIRVGFTVLGTLMFFAVLLGFIHYMNNRNKPDMYSVNSILGGDPAIMADTKVYYFIPRNYDGKLYYIDSNNEKQLVCKNLKDDSYDSVNYSFIEDNELYYSTGLGNRKINLDTCVITELIGDYYFVIKKDDYAIMEKYDYETGTSEMIKYDYKNNKVLDTKTIGVMYSYFKALIDYDNFSFYYVFNDNDHNSLVMLDDEILYESKTKIELLTFNENTLLFYDSANIYRYDLFNREIIDTIEKPFNKAYYIRSDNNINYFIADDMYIFKYDSVIGDLVNITKTSGDKFMEVYHINNKIVFTGYHNIDIFVYDILNDEFKEYDDVRICNYYNNGYEFVHNNNGIFNRVRIE